jgi:tRNA-(ms[2]io[6]A)-hydroxylase
MNKITERVANMDPVLNFLHCETSNDWIKLASKNLDILLVDHANCEKKAASTAINLLYKYTDSYQLINKLSKLAREELRHFEQVVSIMRKRGIKYEHLSPSRYASKLRQFISTKEPEKLVDTCIVCAYIEARSCERFSKLIPILDNELASFYQSLLKSESRHFSDYINLAKIFSNYDISERVIFFGKKEAELILSEDDEFRFHSGITLS